MENIERLYYTTNAVYTQEQVSPLLDALVETKVITLTPSGPYAKVVQAEVPYRLADIESAIDAYASGALPVEGALIVARNDLLGLPHNEQDGGER